MSNLKSWLIKTERLSIVIPECNKTEIEFLLVNLSATNPIIGQCKFGSLDKENIANTNIKLAPQFWGNN